MISETTILKKLRKICLALPAATEGITFGHPTFRIAEKMFAVLEDYKGELGICLKVGTLLQGVFLDDPRLFSHPVHRQARLGHVARLRGAAQLE